MGEEPMSASDLYWADVDADLREEHSRRLVEQARVAALQVWPFLAAATSREDYYNRKALADDRIVQAVSKVADGNPAIHAALYPMVVESLDEDFHTLHEAREREAAKKAREERGRRGRDSVGRGRRELDRARRESKTSAVTVDRLEGNPLSADGWTVQEEGRSVTLPGKPRLFDTREEAEVAAKEWAEEQGLTYEGSRKTAASKAVEDLRPGDMVDLEGDQYADEGGGFSPHEFEYAVVMEEPIDEGTAILVHFENTSVGFPRGHQVEVVDRHSAYGSHKQAVSLTNVGIDPDTGNGVGTDPDGNRVQFRLSDSDRESLRSVLLSDLAVNFSGVDVDQEDIISEGQRKTAEEEEWTPESAWALVGNARMEDLRKMVKALKLFRYTNTPEEERRLSAAEYILKNKVKNPRYSSARKTAARCEECGGTIDPDDGSLSGWTHRSDSRNDDHAAQPDTSSSSRYESSSRQPRFSRESLRWTEAVDKGLVKRGFDVEQLRRIVDNRQHEGGIDMQTANVILTVYDALSEDNREKFEALHPAVAAEVAWKLVASRKQAQEIVDGPDEMGRPIYDTRPMPADVQSPLPGVECQVCWGTGQIAFQDYSGGKSIARCPACNGLGRGASRGGGGDTPFAQAADGERVVAVGRRHEAANITDVTHDENGATFHTDKGDYRLEHAPEPEPDPDADPHEYDGWYPESPGQVHMTAPYYYELTGPDGELVLGFYAQGEGAGWSPFDAAMYQATNFLRGASKHSSKFRIEVEAGSEEQAADSLKAMVSSAGGQGVRIERESAEGTVVVATSNDMSEVWNSDLSQRIRANSRWTNPTFEASKQAAGGQKGPPFESGDKVQVGSLHGEVVSYSDSRALMDIRTDDGRVVEVSPAEAILVTSSGKSSSKLAAFRREADDEVMWTAIWMVGDETFEQPVPDGLIAQHTDWVVQTFPEATDVSYSRPNTPTEASLHKGAPFAGFDSFQDCLDQNQDKDDPEAYCGKIKHQVEDSKESARKAAVVTWEPRGGGHTVGRTPTGHTLVVDLDIAGDGFYGVIEDENGDVIHQDVYSGGTLGEAMKHLEVEYNESVVVPANERATEEYLFGEGAKA